MPVDASDNTSRCRHTSTGIELAVQAMKAHDDLGVQEAAICLLCKLSLKVQLAARIKEETGGVEAVERAVALNIMFWGRQLLARLAHHVSYHV